MEFINVIYYRRPDGKQSVIECTDVYPEDLEYFKSNNIQLSLEQLGTGQIAFYAMVDPDDETSEVLVFDDGENCRNTLRRLAQLCRDYTDGL